MIDLTKFLDRSASYAVIVGIGEYKDERIARLQYTNSDAKAFHELLLNNEHANFRPENVRLLLDSDATLVNIKKSISHWLYKQVREDSTILIFFAGHGGIEGDKTNSEPDGIAKYLLPWDCDKDDLFSSALSSSEFSRLLATVKSKRTVCFLDACYAGGVSKTGSRDVGTIASPIENISQGEGRIVIASARPSQVSWEDHSLQHGIFTHHLLEALKGKADLDNDGYVSIMEIFKYLEKHVPSSSRRLAQCMQEPMLSGDISSDIYITANAMRIAEKHKEAMMAEEARKSEAMAKQQKLLELNISGHLTDEVFIEARNLLKKTPAEMNETEQRLHRNLEAMLRGGITPDIYNDIRNASILHKKEAMARDADTSADDDKRKPPPVPVTEIKFCINCGSRLNPELQFCTNCGKRLSI